MPKSKLTNQERISAVKEYLNGQGSYKTIAEKYGIRPSSLQTSVALFQSQGEAALLSSSKNTHYSPDLKQQDVCKRTKALPQCHP